MRPIVRHGARLASRSQASGCSRVRYSSVPRTAGFQQSRAFNSSIRRSSEPRTPGEHNAWLNQQTREEQKTSEVEGATAEHASETESGEAKTNGEARKPGVRRSIRHRRMTDLPKPPPIPGWFLKHNVTLVKDAAPEPIASGEDAQIVRCVDSETGHTLFTVPYYGAWPEGWFSLAPGKPPGERVVTTLGGKELDVTVLGIDDKFLAALPEEARVEVVTKALIDLRAKKPDEVDLEALGELLVALPRDLQADVLHLEDIFRQRRTGNRSGDDSVDGPVTKPQLSQLHDSAVDQGSKTDDHSSVAGKKFFDQKYPRSGATPSPGPLRTSGQGPSSQEASAGRHINTGYTPMSWLFLEAETSIRAGFALADQSNSSAAFASSRIDLSLHCPDSDSHDQMDALVADLADVTSADVIRIDANDLEELTADYVGQGKDDPGSFATLGYDVFDGYEASSSPGRDLKAFGSPSEDEYDVQEDEYDEDEDEDVDERPESGPAGFTTMEDLRKALYERRHELSKALQGIGIAGITIGTPKIINAGEPNGSGPAQLMQRSFSRGPPSEYVRWDDDRLGALFDGLLDAARQKRNATAPQQGRPSALRNSANTEKQTALGQRTSPQAFRAQTAETLTRQLLSHSDAGERAVKLDFSPGKASPSSSSSPAGTKTIVHLRDLKDICRSRLGEAIVRRLVRVVQKRRSSGDRVLIVGTTAQGSNNIFFSSPGDVEDFPFRTITVPPLFKNAQKDHQGLAASIATAPSKTLKEPAYNRILEINLRHIQSMLRRLKRDHEMDLLTQEARDQMSLPGTQILTERVLSLDLVQRLVLTAIGLTQDHAKADVVQPIHIALATYINVQADHVVQAWLSADRAPVGPKTSKAGAKGKDGSGQDGNNSKVEKIKDSCNQHETRLLTGVVDAQNIKTGFNDVHATPETIDALKTLTTLSLLRPEAFRYGVLANDRLPGLLLYGPPGTGKTLLAKAVAKGSKATVLEVSGAQIYEKYVGEGEKMVRAVFSLAKKLSPCVVFIDEADAIFGSRSSAGNRNTHREIINQFLREWDGMDDHSVFMMVASNRPFDLDDAVLRRLPRRLLVDLPVAKDRESILRIHLKDEVIDSSVDLGKLAEQTPFYSGSDLKNVCVAAALACVREENELAAANKDNEGFTLPEKRTLTIKHFDQATQEISASISEDMASLTAIRKFDEQYGDRKGRRKKTSYGFGSADDVVDESSVRVRQGPAPPAPAEAMPPHRPSPPSP